MVLKVLGALLIAWGIADLIGSLVGVDIWLEVAGIRLQGPMFRVSGWLELIFGLLCWTMGSGPNAGRI